MLIKWTTEGNKHSWLLADNSKFYERGGRCSHIQHTRSSSLPTELL